jgi:hypothetical protein
MTVPEELRRYVRTLDAINTDLSIVLPVLEERAREDWTDPNARAAYKAAVRVVGRLERMFYGG